MALRDGTLSAVALAGRRIDAPDAANIRFPLKMVPDVERELERVLRRERAGYLVCSAACGADLLALRAAKSLGVQNRIVLPFERQRFKAVSVLDRPGDWGDLFDLLVDAAAARNELVVLKGAADDDAKAFAAANERILTEVRDSAFGRKVALAVWEGGSRGDGDATADLLKEAERLDFELATVLTVKEQA
jgi:hypothetical protein